MRSIDDDMHRLGGVALRRQLLAAGHTEYRLRQAVDLGALQPVRRRWLAGAGADPTALRAVSLGGRLTAASALRSHGVWVADDRELWTSVSPTAARLPELGPGERRVWRRERFPDGDERRWRMSVLDSLLHLALHAPPAHLLASVENALHQGLIGRDDVAMLFALLPPPVRRLERRVTGVSESGIETVLRLPLEDEGWSVVPQVTIAGVGRVDLLVEGWVVLECDGREWHASPGAHARDLRRDAALTLLGYRFQRFDHGQIMRSTRECVEVVRAILRAGRPLR